MGYTSCRRNVFLFLSALGETLKVQGVEVKQGALEAASEVYGD